jgi:hypothetical protein
MRALYDTIGVAYSDLRCPDPRIAAAIHAHLEGAASVLNVGAGAGSYEPTHLKVTAVEPSAEMIQQRPEGDAVGVQAAAEDLPFEDSPLTRPWRSSRFTIGVMSERVFGKCGV